MFVDLFILFHIFAIWLYVENPNKNNKMIRWRQSHQQSNVWLFHIRINVQAHTSRAHGCTVFHCSLHKCFVSTIHLHGWCQCRMCRIRTKWRQAAKRKKRKMKLKATKKMKEKDKRNKSTFRSGWMINSIKYI